MVSVSASAWDRRCEARPVRSHPSSFQTRQGVRRACRTPDPGLAVSDWKNYRMPKLNGRFLLNGKLLALELRNIALARHYAGRLPRFVLGTEKTCAPIVPMGARYGKIVSRHRRWGVNISRDGKLLAAAYGDGTIRWYRPSDGQELLALFVHAKDRRFIAWTPKGYYAASPGAEDLIGWHVNRDWDHAADFFPASRFRDQFNRPDIVKRALTIWTRTSR